MSELNASRSCGMDTSKGGGVGNHDEALAHDERSEEERFGPWLELVRKGREMGKEAARKRAERELAWWRAHQAKKAAMLAEQRRRFAALPKAEPLPEGL
jgi:hypothetical protein